MCYNVYCIIVIILADHNYTNILSVHIVAHIMIADFCD